MGKGREERQTCAPGSTSAIPRCISYLLITNTSHIAAARSAVGVDQELIKIWKVEPRLLCTETLY